MFDPVKGSFILVASVIGVQLIIALATVGSCIYAGFLGFDTSKCGDTRVAELLAAALASALAFQGINNSKS